jgi:DNA-binding CsgD family transcriptional regulator
LYRVTVYNRFDENLHMEKIASVSVREVEVLKCIADGFTSSQIAYTLKISVKTVETHRKNLQHKFTAINACQLVYKAAKRNII